MKYDQPIQVTEGQYNFIMNKLCGICAGTEIEGKFFIKVWVMGYVKEIKKVLTFVK